MERSMRILQNGLIVAAAVALFAGSASASTYEFSYSFGAYGPGLITGSFTGTGPVSDVTNISNISVEFNGVPLTGTLDAFSYIGSPSGGCYTPSDCFSAGGATASSDPLNNNFVFINSSAVTNTSVFTPPFTNYFYMIPWGNGAGNPEAVQYYSAGSFVPSDQYNGDLIPSNWSLTETPLPSAWTMMLIGLAGLGFVGYRQNKKVALSAAA